MTRFPYPYPFQSDDESRGSSVGWLIVILLVLLIAILVYFAPRGLQITGDLMMPAVETEYFANPELAAFYRFPETVRMRTYLAFNPELAVMRRFENERAPIASAVQQGSNPLEQFYVSVDPGGEYLDSAFLSRNPEVALFYNYVAARR